MVKRLVLTCALSVIALAVNAQIPTIAPMDLGVTQRVDMPYWQGKAQCWRDLAAAEASQGDTHGTAATSTANADAIASALVNGSEPRETAIFTRKILPSTDTKNGRPQWRADILSIDGALERYSIKRCRTRLSGCLEVAQQSVYENMEETQGARWNHGRPEIDKALALANQVDADMRTCEQPPEPIAMAPVVKEELLAADVLFAFDSAVLTAEGNRVIASLADRMVRDGIRTANVVGHTDRFGSATYNLELSKRRGSAVEKLLRDRAASVRVSSSGVGSEQPVVTCLGRETATTIACLAPNRRVVIQTTK